MKTAVFTFGRFNPPTVGHYKLVKQVEAVADNYHADMFIFPSRKISKKDPIPVKEKVEFMKLSFPEYSSSIIDEKSLSTILYAASWLYQKKYTDIIAVFGSDRVSAFDHLLKKYNGVKGSHGFYEFDKIEVASAGDRDPDSDGVAGMSASKLRSYALEGDHPSFRKGTSPNLSDKDCHRMYMVVRKGLGIKEEVFYERKLTKGEEEKREEIVLALKKKYPNWPKDKIYAVATQKAKEATERVDNNPKRDSKRVMDYRDFVAHVGTDQSRIKAQAYTPLERVKKF
tara:strand:+ start:26901 stop:27752 length:852 start_codon:yes stop_codon:yes gene_type:complete